MMIRAGDLGFSGRRFHAPIRSRDEAAYIPLICSNNKFLIFPLFILLVLAGVAVKLNLSRSLVAKD